MWLRAEQMYFLGFLQGAAEYRATFRRHLGNQICAPPRANLIGFFFKATFRRHLLGNPICAPPLSNLIAFFVKATFRRHLGNQIYAPPRANLIAFFVKRHLLLSHLLGGGSVLDPHWEGGQF